MTAPTKSQIQFVKSLQSRKTRDELGLFVAETPKVVAELLAAGNVQVQDVFATPAWAKAHRAAVRRAGGALVEVGDQALARMSSLTTPNQVIAVFSKPRFAATTVEGGGRQFTLVLDAVQDPGNIGTIIRCADWFGVAKIVCGPGCADAFNSKVIQSTMGSIARVCVEYEADLPGLVASAKRLGNAAIYAATLDGISISEEAATWVDASEAGAFLIIGNESRGISHELLALATRHVMIPRHGQAESLNAGVATGILLSWFLR